MITLYGHKENLYYNLILPLGEGKVEVEVKAEEGVVEGVEGVEEDSAGTFLPIFSEK